ncbi:uncharacterized protein [Temnothorax longispinosus]|uniref:uncharacterized protein n=1 Tax=Temnothorax longispinosus TaxID=300112 RepID=UPI003A9A08B1
MEQELLEQSTLLNSREDFAAWEQRCDEFIESLEEQSRIKRPRLSIDQSSIGLKQSLVACIARLEGLKDLWYKRHVIEPTLAKLEEFQERDSGWALSRILNLMVNVNKYNPLHAGCIVEIPQEIKKKNAVINVRSIDNACFAWSVVAALYPVEEHTYRKSSYPHYTSVLDLTDIEFPMTLDQIKKFENHNNISINVYSIEKKNKKLTILPIRVTDRKMDRHVNLLYVHNDNVGHFAWIKNLSRLVSSQINRHHGRKYFCDRCLHYFSSNEKLTAHTVDCQEMNDCAIKLPSDNDKWLAFKNHNRKERVPFVVYADLECTLEKMEADRATSRYALANNKYMQLYDPSKPSSYLMYFDVNNLYGWAMSQPLPYADFKWVDDVTDFNVMDVALDSPIGYILEVDLEYPQHLHDAHTDLPFCPTRDKPPGKRQDKLLATLYDKKRYVIHYRNLQQCTRHGLRISKIHRILKFAQSPWLRDYIDLNTKFRTLANNDFEKNLYKLMNNAVFGKTMENVRNHVDVRLVTHWEGRYGAEAMIAKPNFHSRSVFSENLVAIEMRKLEVKFDKPIYVGMCILDISKTCLYEFHHEYMLPLYRDKCKVTYTDTDSLIYHIECDDVYDIMKRHIHRFDTSDYAIDNTYGIPLANKKVPGLMKDENNGAIMTEFVGLRAKMYALRVDGKKDTKKAKGVKSNVCDVVGVQKTNPVTFLLEDSRGKPVAGGFYEYELHRVANPDVYLVEKVLRKRGDEVYVKWLGFDNSYNSWIHKNNVL